MLLDPLAAVHPANWKKEGKLVGKEVGAGGELGYESALKENSRQFG